MKKQNIEDIFSSMENFSSVPPPELWGKIEEKLNKPKKKKRAILWWSAAACLLLGLMLPTVLHFNSDSGIKTIDTSSEKNNVVLDDKKTESDDLKTRSTEENNIQNETVNKINSGENAIVLRNSSDKETKNALDPSQINQDQKTTVTDINSKNKGNKEGVLNVKSNLEVHKPNQAVAEKSFAPNNDNGFNTASKAETLNSEKRNSNKAVAGKSFVPNNEKTFNSSSKYQIPNSENTKTNQAVAEKTSVPNKTNAVNSGSENSLFNAKNAKANQAVAEKSFVPNKTNAVNSGSENQTPTSIFEEKLNPKNNTNFALNSSNSNSTNNQNRTNDSKKEFKNETITNEKAFASNQKSSSRFGDALSKQDSVQLAELQNLEKGIVAVTPETKKEKEAKDKAIAKNEKWALEVFAGVANSENYKNEKTLGSVNDSKQSNSYGVKTKYKINKKWAVSSGVKFNELGQSIANVSYMRTTNAFLTSSDYFNQNATVAAAPITDNSSYVFVPKNTIMALKSDNVESGKLDQSLRYLEVPLEVSYSVFNRNKTNISLNTGGFVGKLISNNMALNGNSIGENTGANDYVYGSLLSSTIQYRIYKKTNVFVEPAMNYYINPLNEQSFNQFQWGLNFGLNVSF
ncbi:hypothetical protein [Flavobacterium sp. N1736]|uniref:hypothetical protein n=1 Tax=Flavobacterium sp. N1736 TaxID=2986823 RepID=UPI002225048A|nr:hypothetical protein [Flavobacterium sp. N1736]